MPPLEKNNCETSRPRVTLGHFEKHGLFLLCVAPSWVSRLSGVPPFRTALLWGTQPFLTSVTVRSFSCTGKHHLKPMLQTANSTSKAHKANSTSSVTRKKNMYMESKSQASQRSLLRVPRARNVASSVRAHPLHHRLLKRAAP